MSTAANSTTMQYTQKSPVQYVGPVIFVWNDETWRIGAGIASAEKERIFALMKKVQLIVIIAELQKCFHYVELRRKLHT